MKRAIPKKPKGAGWLALLAFCVAMTPAVALAEIVKTAGIGNDGIELYWWPRLPPVPGRRQDMGSSQHYMISALAPDGASFSDADAVMYGRAIYKPRMPEVKTLAAFIEQDKENVSAEHLEMRVEKLPDIVDADGRHLIVFAFKPGDAGNWEAVAYGEEGDFFLIFCVSSRTEKSYKANFGIYSTMVRNYRKNWSSK